MYLLPSSNLDVYTQNRHTAQKGDVFCVLQIWSEIGKSMPEQKLRSYENMLFS